MEGFGTSTIAALLRLGSLAHDNWDTSLQEILVVTSDLMKAARVSYWRRRDEPPSIVCELGYHGPGQRFERGFVLRREECLSYFKALGGSPVVVVEDTMRDERTACLRAYFESRGIGAMLDVAIRAVVPRESPIPVGVLCAEHIGGPRIWSPGEQQFVLAVAQILATKLEARARSQAENRERQAVLMYDATAALSETHDVVQAIRLAARRAIPALGEMAMIVMLNGADGRQWAVAHVDEKAVPPLEEFLRQYPPTLDGPGFVSHAMRERQSLLVPFLTLESARNYGIPTEHLAAIASLGARAAMAVPLDVKGKLTGAMMFARSSGSYGPEDLSLAERYTQRIAVLLDNAYLYQQAQDAIAARDEFLGLASHELRTPITSLRLFAQQLAQKLPQLSPEMVAGLSNRILRQATRLDRMAGRLLDACEVGAGSPSIEWAETDLNQVVDDVAHMFEETAARAGSDLRVSTPGPVVGIWDPVRLEQVIGNLVDNAIKFGAGKPIQIELGLDHTWASVRVRDHGAGILQEDQNCIFDRYARAGSARGFGGLGLGLHIAKEIAQALGGAVEVESLVGEGSTFTLRLPLGVARQASGT